MTAEELLATMAEPFAEGESYCTIDPETRVITIPPEYQLLGVESDEKAERLYFKCPKIVGDNIDLSKLALRVNFRNAGQVVDQYLVDDVAVDGDNITFSWLLSRRVTQYEGTVSFIVCAVKVSGDTITNEWNTTLAEAEVLEGLEVEVTLPEEETDIVSQLLALAETRLNDVREATTDANTAASNANQKAQEATNAAEDARAVTEQITKDSYLHTALQSFIDTVTATPTAYGNAIVKKIEGFTRQETTKGLNLMPLEPHEANATVTITDDGKTYRVVGKNAEDSSGYVWFIIPKDLSELKGRKIYASDYDTERFGNGSGTISIFQATSSGVTNGLGGLPPNGFVTVPEQLREDTEFIAVLLFAKSSAPVTTSDGNTFSNLWLSLNEPLETWEPYTGGQPAPNPDYPMEVQGIGYKGFFDGEFTSGLISTSTGEMASDNTAVTTNKIPCNPNDVVKVKYDGESAYIHFSYYREDGTFIRKEATSLNPAEKTVPSDCKYFRISIQGESSFLVSSVKHVAITINGKYAVCVKVKGKNLIPYPYESKSGTANEVNYKFDSAGRGILYGTATASGVVKLMQRYQDNDQYDKIMELKAGQKYYAKDVQIFLINNGVESYINAMDSAQYYTAKSGDNVAGIRLLISVGQTYTTDRIFEPMFCEYEEGDDTTFVSPAQSNITYIPVDYPLFEGDKIIQRNGEYKLVRKWGVQIDDGTHAWKKNSPSDNSDYMYYRNTEPDKDATKLIYCNRLKRVANAEKSVGISLASLYPKAIYVRLDADILPINDVGHFNQWLSDNPLTIVYPMETPTEETLSPEAVKALHSIMSTDEQTELTIVGVPADAGIQNQFLLPRNEDGALNTTAYCTAEKNKIVLNELVAQNLDSRVNKLEIDNAALAEQTIIVE